MTGEKPRAAKFLLNLVRNILATLCIPAIIVALLFWRLADTSSRLLELQELKSAQRSNASEPDSSASALTTSESDSEHNAIARKRAHNSSNASARRYSNPRTNPAEGAAHVGDGGIVAPRGTLLPRLKDSLIEDCLTKEEIEQRLALIHETILHLKVVNDETQAREWAPVIIRNVQELAADIRNNRVRQTYDQDRKSIESRGAFEGQANKAKSTIQQEVERWRQSKWDSLEFMKDSVSDLVYMCGVGY